MLKMIYLARRKSGFTFDEFVCRWRKHGALGMEQTTWRHTLAYVQAEPILPAPIPGASGEFDAIACFMVRDGLFSEMTEEDMAGATKMAEDELKTFSAPIPTTALWVKEEHVRKGELGGITAFLFFDDASTAREIARRGHHAASLNRITLNLLDDALPAEMQTLPYQAVVELSASSVPALAEALGTAGDSLITQSDLAVVTREAVFWDRLQ